ncbi:class I SAM-dependent RNA methyltransferase [Nocardioides ferulae]|uniref:class I SAM-dependent RNA methyltransferase n=1 Tax=Nocardioides ferulae TaxID=2340821 RepID=UPI000EB07605|nr:TRAM domain-containing protein [Nocardioides ferulae]
MSRQVRARRPRGASRVGARFEVVVGPVAHGGHCVARVPDEQSPSGTRVVFVRHTLPGERIVLEVTEGTEGDRFWRADAVEVLEASPDRVAAPCRLAGPGLCGGCDFQHVTLERQRGLKADVVREQLSRLAGLDVPVEVEAVPAPPGDPAAADVDQGLRWRTRVQWASGPRGERALRKHRSREVVVVDDCPITRRDARDAAARGTVVERVDAAGAVHGFEVDADGFWQVHPGAPATLVEAVLAALAPRPGERVLDLYAGVGLFARFLADAVGPGGRVVAVEADRRAAGHAAANLAGAAEVARGPVDRVLATAYDEPFDLVVLDPPREGARRPVVEQVVARSPRGVAYVACDPAALARDVGIFAEHGYNMSGLRAFDLFPMTHHVECVALLERTDSDLR